MKEIDSPRRESECASKMSAKPEYAFSRDYLDNCRINLQHYQWIQLFGYHLHPQISLGAEVRIADVATGTGIWLTDMSTRLPPTAQLDGLDISLKSTPPEQCLPPNVTFRLWDIKEAVPQDLVEKYDVVHVRLLIFVLHNDEVPVVLQNLTKLLKPGGYLQWADIDVASFRTEKIHPTAKTDALDRLFRGTQTRDSRLTSTWVPQLGTQFSTTAGLCNVLVDKRDAHGHLAMAMHECNLMVPELLCRTTSDAEAADRLAHLLAEAAEETRRGAYWALTRWTVVGRKPGKLDVDL
ncbi:S-adenosyl-L-methionine-dependent methyltransferase [Nemania sp. FL0031]|nr:S-adenosyl-L-methionine-dependent methyltransferase [Nemania sp. FL0031]